MFFLTCSRKVLLLFCLTVIFSLVTAQGKSPEQRELDEARRKWTKQSFYMYTFVSKINGFVPYEMSRELLVTVVDDNIVDVQYYYPVDENDIFPLNLYGQVMTIHQVFATIQNALNREQPLAHFEVIYDNPYGPSYVNIDFDTMIADEEFMMDLSFLSGQRIEKNTK